jgi:hypothetical protein
LTGMDSQGADSWRRVLLVGHELVLAVVNRNLATLR